MRALGGYAIRGHVARYLDSISSNRALCSTLLLSSVLFALNYFHQDQIGIYYGRFIPLAESIREISYTYPWQADSLATYPIWGYAILVAALDPILGTQGVYVFQYLLLLLSFWFVQRFFDVPNWQQPVRAALFHGTLVAYGMFLSVKWPMAVVAFLLLVFGLLHERRHYGLASLALLLATHFRYEALLLWMIYAMFMVVGVARHRFSVERMLHGKARVGVLVVCSAALLTSWPLFHYSQDGRLLIGTTNSGGTLYSSLGQLPNNPWGRIFADRSAGEYALSQGVSDAWGPEGNRVLTRRFLQDVAEHPLAFAGKVLYNQFQILAGGFYASELRTLSVRHDSEKDQEQRLLLARYQQDFRHLFKDMFALNVHTYTMLSQLALTVLSVLLLLGLISTAAIRIARRELDLFKPYIWMIAGQFAVIGVYVYQSRQVSTVVALFLFALYSLRPELPTRDRAAIHRP